MNPEFISINVGQILKRIKDPVALNSTQEYQLITIKMHHLGVVPREKKKASSILSKMFKVRANQFVISGIDARNGAFGFIPESLDGAIITNDFWCFDIDEKLIDRNYFYWLSASELFLDACIHASEGTTNRKRLNKEKFFEYKFELPIRSEQARIAEKLSSRFNLIKSLQKESSIQLATSDSLQYASIKEGLYGHLTNEWREKNLVKETAKDALIMHLKRKAEMGLREYKSKPDLGVSIPIEKLPEGWVLSKLGDIGNNEPYPFVDGPFGSSINVKTDYIKSGVPVLRMLNVKPFEFKPDELKFVSKEKFEQFRRHNVRPFDVLFSKVGAGIGEACVVPAGFPEAMLSTTGIIRLRVGEIVRVEYLCYFLNAHRNEFVDQASKTAQPFLNMTTIREFPFPLPPLAEQDEIILRMKKSRELCVELRTEVLNSTSLAKSYFRQFLTEQLRAKLVIR